MNVTTSTFIVEVEMVMSFKISSRIIFFWLSTILDLSDISAYMFLINQNYDICGYDVM